MVVRTAESEEKGRSHCEVLGMCMVVVRTAESEGEEEEKERTVREPLFLRLRY